MKTQVKIPKTNIKEVIIPIRGISPLIVHNFSDKSKQQMLDIQNKSAKKNRTRNPEEEYLNCLYHLNGSNGKTGFKAMGFKLAMVRAGKALGYVMTDLYSAIFVEPDDGGELVEVHGKHRMRVGGDYVRLSNGSADIRYRAEYPKWKCKLRIAYNANVLSNESLAQLVQEAGFGVGIGDWRPQKKGDFGRWEIDN